MHLAETEKLLVLSTLSIDIDAAERRGQGQRRLDMRTRCGFSQRNNPEKNRLWLEKPPNRSTVLPELAGHVSLGRPGHSAGLLSHHSASSQD